MVEGLYIAAAKGAALSEVPRLEVVAGMGILGDRNFGGSQFPGQNLTLIEAEAVEEIAANLGVDIRPHETRRNVVVRGEGLNALVGATFRIGSVVLRGVEPCEPCESLTSYLAHTGLGRAVILRAFLGKGGLRCDCLVGGVLEVGQELVVEPV